MVAQLRDFCSQEQQKMIKQKDGVCHLFCKTVYRMICLFKKVFDTNGVIRIREYSFFVFVRFLVQRTSVRLSLGERTIFLRLSP